MAEEKRGGSRIPKNPASYSGAGKQSRRTDGQPIRTPNVQEGTDLTQGDRRVIEQGQRTQPLSRSSEPRMQMQQSQGSRSFGPTGTEEVPSFLFDMESTRPMEDPMTAPPPMPEQQDLRVIALERYARNGNPEAQAMLSRHYAKQTQQTAQIPMMQGPTLPLGEGPPVVEEPVEEEMPL